LLSAAKADVRDAVKATPSQKVSFLMRWNG
jgi:hypothetical protein